MTDKQLIHKHFNPMNVYNVYRNNQYAGRYIVYLEHTVKWIHILNDQVFVDHD